MARWRGRGLIPDLLFGSRVQAGLRAAGHEVELVGGERSGCGAGWRLRCAGRRSHRRDWAASGLVESLSATGC